MEILNTILFYIFSIFAIVSTISIIYFKRFAYCVIFALIAFLSFAGFYFLLNASFNAVAQISIYGLGVTLLLLFAIMLVTEKEEYYAWLKISFSNFLGILGLIFILISVFVFLFDNFKGIVQQKENMNLSHLIDTTTVIGLGIFKNYLLAFELLSIFLLIVIIGISIVCTYSHQGGKK